MAKLKDLAGLAALGAIGYKLAQDRDNTTASAYPTGVMGGARIPVASDSMMDQGDGSVVPRPGQSTITGDQVNPDADTGDTSNYGNEGMRPLTPASAVKQSVSAKSKPSRMTDKQNTALANAAKQAQMAADNDALARANTNIKPSTSSAGTRNPRTGRRETSFFDMPVSTGKARPLPPGARFVPGFGAVDENDNIIPGYMGGYDPNAGKTELMRNPRTGRPMKKGGAVKKMAKGGMTSMASSASKRADGIASKGKTKCKMY